MKIAFDYQTFCHQKYGGISRYIKCLAEALVAQDQRVNIFAPYHRNYYLESASSDLVIGRNAGSYPPKTARIFIFLNRMVCRNAIRRSQPDIVHETYYSAKRSAPKKYPTIITVHDMIHEKFPAHSLMGDKTTENKRIAIERADHIICISHNTRNDLHEIFDLPRRMTSVVHHGFDKLEYLEPNKGCPDVGNNFVLFIGSRGGYKNFKGILEAFRSSKKLANDFNIVAFGSNSFNPEEQAAIKNAGLRPAQVIQLSGDDIVLKGLYRTASALVFPSKYEGFGLPLIEAMAYNCPIISSNASCMPEIAGDAAEYFDPNSSEELASALESVLYSDCRRDQLVTLGAKRRTNYSWDKCAKETLSVYRNVIE